VRTIVVGFGVETGTGDGPDVLNSVALAGGFGRTCPTGADVECGTGDTCDVQTRQCRRAFFQAGNADQLASILSGIADRIGTGDPCHRKLSVEPSDPALLIVSVDGRDYLAGDDTWQYDNGFINFQGSLCARLQAATPSQPADVQYHIVRLL
jgi:hypothetical protein